MCHRCLQSLCISRVTQGWSEHAPRSCSFLPEDHATGLSQSQGLSQPQKDGCDVKVIEMYRDACLPAGLLVLALRGLAACSNYMAKLCNCAEGGAYRREVIEGQLMNGHSLSSGNIIACNALSLQLINFLSE